MLLSIPHGGQKSPHELEKFLCISKQDLFDDIDPYVREIYDLRDKVTKVISTDIARTFVDQNRSKDDLPPKNPDGVIKSTTCYGRPIYLEEIHKNSQLVDTLLSNYYETYHKNIQDALKLEIKFAFDCHSMASQAPQIAPDSEQNERPLFCISNQDGKTCTNSSLKKLGKSIQEAFDVSEKDIKFNDPFKGGYLTRTYGNNPVPWIQIEMNRKMYLEKPWFDKTSLSMDKKRLEELNKKFEKSLEIFFN